MNLQPYQIGSDKQTTFFGQPQFWRLLETCTGLSV